MTSDEENALLQRNEEATLGAVRLFEKLHRRMRIVVILLSFTLVIAGAAIVLGQVNNSRRIADIQRSRRDSLVQQCVETNLRHDRLLDALERTSPGLSIFGREQLAQAAAPHIGDCVAHAERLTQVRN